MLVKDSVFGRRWVAETIPCYRGIIRESPEHGIRLGNGRRVILCLQAAAVRPTRIAAQDVHYIVRHAALSPQFDTAYGIGAVGASSRIKSRKNMQHFTGY